MSGDDRGDWQRLDKWLWCARFLRHRADCTRLVAGGLVRINRAPTDKPHARLRVGDVLTVPLGHEVRVVRVLALAPRRGPAAEAATLYQAIDAPASCADAKSPAYAAPELQGLPGGLR
ncbi:RNA-binding S4 domain-containing protein [Acidisphaera rubrifaciens]|uniref:RNA-binding S4 domain protein n=1 Tax=Acidisphaera rubrifaciens HS-AP3 TaxID=1231350 RepID=A0A0D6PA52_9PROT|nr:S4 domain-containing protein [Acidisphaera rubrifaciens]GAN77744.1 RNA-binding S4 domain protein [Acidisphaera rubrifaciens HS-AP3]